MKISVILSNYNGARHIGATLRSVFAQSRRPDELIVVDDASTDDSIEVIETVLPEAGFPTRLIVHERNGGQAAGFNTAFKASTGELVSTLDADDLWKEHKLREVESVSASRTGFSILQHQLEIYRDSRWTGEAVLPALTTGDVWKMWLKYGTFPHFVPTSGLTFRREVLEQVMPIPESLRISADSFLTRTSICHGPVVSIEQMLGGYRIHAENSVASNAAHDAWAYFLANVRPLLLAYYESRGFERPRGYMDDGQAGRSSGLMDLSPRKVLRKLKSFSAKDPS